MKNIINSDLKRITLDFDGSVISTDRYAEGTAVGYNSLKKGNRSYYPLFSTIAQTGQVFNVLHRPGNVHDSNGALDFIFESINKVRKFNKHIKIETRMDSAFYVDDVLKMLHKNKVEFSISAPFERFPELKEKIENRNRWKKINSEWSYFEISWCPKKWKNKQRLIFYRHKEKVRNKLPVQLDLFFPTVYGYNFKAVITNKKVTAKRLLQFHNGRGNQENVFGELKSQCNMDYVPVRNLVGNKLYLMSSILSFNFFRDLQIQAEQIKIKNTPNRSPSWIFQKAKTFCTFLLHIAGRVTRPGGKLRLTMAGNKFTEKRIRHYIDKLKAA